MSATVKQRMIVSAQVTIHFRASHLEHQVADEAAAYNTACKRSEWNLAQRGLDVPSTKVCALDLVHGPISAERR